MLCLGCYHGLSSATRPVAFPPSFPFIFPHETLIINLPFHLLISIFKIEKERERFKRGKIRSHPSTNYPDISVNSHHIDDPNAHVLLFWHKRRRSRVAAKHVRNRRNRRARKAQEARDSTNAPESSPTCSLDLDYSNKSHTRSPSPVAPSTLCDPENNRVPLLSPHLFNSTSPCVTPSSVSYSPVRPASPVAPSSLRDPECNRVPLFSPHLFNSTSPDSTPSPPSYSPVRPASPGYEPLLPKFSFNTTDISRFLSL